MRVQTSLLIIFYCMKIFFTLTTSVKLKDRHAAQKETWLKGLDYVYASDINCEDQLKFSDKRDHQSAEEKQLNSLKYLCQAKKDYDWYFFGDDDTFVNVKNLTSFLETVPPHVLSSGRITHLNMASSSLLHFLSLKYKKLVNQNPISKYVNIIDKVHEWMKDCEKNDCFSSDLVRMINFIEKERQSVDSHDIKFQEFILPRKFPYYSGGAGFVLRREALEVLSTWEEFPYSSFSDVSMGLLMKEHNLPLYDNLKFEGGAPFGGQYSSSSHGDSLEKIKSMITYHYLKPQEMKKLYKLIVMD